MTGAQDVGAYGFCDTLPIAVQSVCNTPGNINGYYYCGIDIKPNCNEDYAGAYRAGLVSMDEYDRTGVAELHSPFESLTKFDLTVLLEDGPSLVAERSRRPECRGHQGRDQGGWPQGTDHQGSVDGFRSDQV